MAIAERLIEPPTKCHWIPPITSTIARPSSASTIQIAEFAVLFCTFGWIPHKKVINGQAQIYPPVTPASALIPPWKFAKIGRPTAPKRTYTTIVIVPSFAPSTAPDKCYSKYLDCNRHSGRHRQ